MLYHIHYKTYILIAIHDNQTKKTLIPQFFAITLLLSEFKLKKLTIAKNRKVLAFLRNVLYHRI